MVEYLLVAAAAIGAIMAIVMSNAVAWKTLEVSNNEITKVNGIPLR